MTRRDYAIFDVFTDRALAGNALAVVFDSAGLDDAAMQRIAREFNLSETVFVAPARDRVHRARVRIFTPAHELPFAGHPTVGAAIALAERDAGKGAAAILVLEEAVGAVRCAVSSSGGVSFAEFDLPRLAEELPLSASREAIAAALGLDRAEIGFENHRPGLWSAGVPYVTVPVAGLEAAAKAAVDSAAWLALAPRIGGGIGDPYIYTRESVNHDCAFHARMFAPYSGIPEDPATGSAVAALSGAIVKHDEPVDGPMLLWVEQGLEMGRPSRIRLEVDVEAGRASGARIGGHAVKVAEGVLFV